MDNEIQNKITAILAAIVGFLGFLSWIMPQIEGPIKPMINQLPEEYQAMATALVGIVIIVVYAWNYTSSIELAKDKKTEGMIEIINAGNKSKK